MSDPNAGRLASIQIPAGVGMTNSKPNEGSGKYGTVIAVIAAIAITFRSRGREINIKGIQNITPKNPIKGQSDMFLGKATRVFELFSLYNHSGIQKPHTRKDVPSIINGKMDDFDLEVDHHQNAIESGSDNWGFIIAIAIPSPIKTGRFVLSAHQAIARPPITRLSTCP